MQVQAVPRRCSSDGGAALVEAAIIGPIFLYLIFGVLEFGRAFFVRQSAYNATLYGSRGASIAGARAQADYELLQSFVAGARAFDYLSLNYVVVWHAEKATSDITVERPSDCAVGIPYGFTLTAAQVTAMQSQVPATYTTRNFCNVYTPTQLENLMTLAPSFGCTKSTSPDRYWCPLNRNTANAPLSPTGVSQAVADYIGIYISYDFKYATGLFGQGRTFTMQSIARIEPQAS